MLVPNSKKVSALFPKSPDITEYFPPSICIGFKDKCLSLRPLHFFCLAGYFHTFPTDHFSCLLPPSDLSHCSLSFFSFFLGSHQVIHLLTPSHLLPSSRGSGSGEAPLPGVAGIKRPCEPCAAVQPWRVSDCLPNLPWQIDRCTRVAVWKWNRSFMEYKVKLGSVWGEHESSAGAAAAT